MTVAASWKVAGFTYNQYLAIAARVIRKSLKDDLRIKAERRDNFDLKFTKWENGKGGEPKTLIGGIGSA